MERTDHLVCLVCPGRWVREVSRVPEGSMAFPDPQEFLVLREALVRREMRGLQDPQDPLV